MTTMVPTHAAPAVRRLAESRPPCLTLRPLRAAPAATPPCPAAAPAPLRREGRVSVLRASWTAVPEAGLPDAGGWSAALAVAVVEALLARRPVAQLNRWLSDEVLASVTLHQRRRRAATGSATPPQLVTVRVQHPSPRAAEVAALLRVGRRPLVLAFRLEALGERWLCTALELGRPGADDDAVTPAAG